MGTLGEPAAAAAAAAVRAAEMGVRLKALPPRAVGVWLRRLLRGRRWGVIGRYKPPPC